jgi:hypothetical protein
VVVGEVEEHRVNLGRAAPGRRREWRSWADGLRRAGLSGLNGRLGTKAAHNHAREAAATRGDSGVISGALGRDRRDPGSTHCLESHLTTGLATCSATTTAAQIGAAEALKLSPRGWRGRKTGC